MSVRDQGYPNENSATTDLKIFIERTIKLPVFIEDEYSMETGESESVDSVIGRVKAELEDVVVSLTLFKLDFS